MREPWKPMTFTEIGRRLGISHQRVNALHAKLLKELKETLIEEPEVRDWLIDQGENPESMINFTAGEQRGNSVELND
jgi:hypothetical protein